MQAVANRAGALDVAVVVKLNKYFDMVEQSKAFRGSLRETLLANSGNVRRSLTELQAYVNVLNIQKSIGEDLIKDIENIYH